MNRDIQNENISFRFEIQAILFGYTRNQIVKGWSHPV